jgi:phage tail sheath gpL-like
MAISFNDIPAASRVPFVFAEFDGSNAVQGPQILNFRGLLIGQKLSAGTATANTPVLVTSAAQAKSLFGAGSILAGMFEAWFYQNSFTEVWALPVDDNVAGVAATGSIALTGSASAAGTLTMTIAGRDVQVGVASGNSAASIATALSAAINANTDLPVTASVLSGTVTLTAKNKGETGNDIDIRYAANSLPTGIAAAITAMASGATNPSLAAGIAAMGDDWFHISASAFRDAANLLLLKNEMDSRWGPIRQIDGHVFVGFNGTVGASQTLGNQYNDKHLTIVAGQRSPTPAYEIAAESAAIGTYYLSIDPARPLQTLGFKWMKAPLRTQRYTLTERNTLLYSGIATVKVDQTGAITVERFITTYKTNAAGGNDPAYLDIETLATLQYIRWDWRNMIMRKYPRHKLANDGTRFAPGQAIVTPSVIKAEAVNKFADWEALGLVEGFAQFKRDLIVERNASDPNRLDVLLPPDLVNQLRIMATQIQFLL